MLAAHSELGYTSRPQEALAGEPEAVDEGEQRRQTKAAALRADTRLAADWRRARDGIAGELAWLQSRPAARALESDLRVIARVVDRIDRRLGL